MEQTIINKAKELAKADFMAYPDFDQDDELGLADALTILIADHFPDTASEDIFTLINMKLK